MRSFWYFMIFLSLMNLELASFGLNAKSVCDNIIKRNKYDIIQPLAKVNDAT